MKNSRVDTDTKPPINPCLLWLLGASFSKHSIRRLNPVKKIVGLPVRGIENKGVEV